MINVRGAVVHRLLKCARQCKLPVNLSEARSGMLIFRPKTLQDLRREKKAQQESARKPTSAARLRTNERPGPPQQPPSHRDGARLAQSQGPTEPTPTAPMAPPVSGSDPGGETPPPRHGGGGRGDGGMQPAAGLDEGAPDTPQGGIASDAAAPAPTGSTAAEVPVPLFEASKPSAGVIYSAVYIASMLLLTSWWLATLKSTCCTLHHKTPNTENSTGL